MNSVFAGKNIDISILCGKIQKICKDYAETSQRKEPSERGDGVSPLFRNLSATSCVTRDDRGGCSRYRAAKMSPLGMN